MKRTPSKDVFTYYQCTFRINERNIEKKKKNNIREVSGGQNTVKKSKVVVEVEVREALAKTHRNVLIQLKKI